MVNAPVLQRAEPSLTLDNGLTHPLAGYHYAWAEKLFAMYRTRLRDILCVFKYQDEIDLFCRCEALDASGKKDLNVSAALELQRLIETTRRQFYDPFDRLAVEPTRPPPHSGPCARDRTCADCHEIKLARAAACYRTCYLRASKESNKARSRILSFPWLFGALLMELKGRNQYSSSNQHPSKCIVVGRAMRRIAARLCEQNHLHLKTYCSAYSDAAYLFLRSIDATVQNQCYAIKRDIVERDRQTEFMCLSKVLFIEIMNYWIEQQLVFGACKFSFLSTR